jgi:hypothetical protein
MLFQKHILSMAVVLAIGAMPAFASQAPSGKSKSASKPSVSKTHEVQGSLVSATDESLTIRSGKKDMSFKISSTTQKPTTMTPGSNVTVQYHDEGTQHIASNIQLAPTKPSATAARSPASK